MKTLWELFRGPSGLAIAYETAIKDVRAEMDKLILKKPPSGKTEDFKVGWNSALIALSKAIRLPQGER